MAKIYEKAYSASGDRLFAADEFAAAKAKLLMFRILSIDVDGVEPPVWTGRTRRKQPLGGARTTT
jgi:hypothetical protein